MKPVAGLTNWGSERTNPKEKNWGLLRGRHKINERKSTRRMPRLDANMAIMCKSWLRWDKLVFWGDHDQGITLLKYEKWIRQSDLMNFKLCRTSERETSLRLNIVSLT